MNNIILGTMNIGYKYSSNQNNTLEYYKSIIDRYIQLTNKNERMLDTAYYYANTKTEQILGEILPKLDTHVKIATKANPWYMNDFTNGKLGQLSKPNIEKQLTTSLTNLGRDYVDIFFLHCPDYETPIIETLEACNDFWRQGKFNNIGISNFSAYQMEEILNLCDNHKIILPTFYQGMYNLISRNVEEIFPLLEDYDIEFWAYNPLAGGLLTGKYQKNNDIINNSRFKNNAIYQNLFWKEPILKTFESFLESKHCCEYSLVWLDRQIKKLKPSGKIIIGASTIEQLNQNITYLYNNNYNVEYDNKINRMYSKIKNISANYYY